MKFLNLSHPNIDFHKVCCLSTHVIKGVIINILSGFSDFGWCVVFVIKIGWSYRLCDDHLGLVGGLIQSPIGYRLFCCWMFVDASRQSFCVHYGEPSELFLLYPPN